jgi:uncharacterized RmlC-like cupin family protein
MSEPSGPIDWRTNGVEVILGDRLDVNTPQTSGMNRAAAINLVVNLDVEPVEQWVDPIHRYP